MFEAQAKIEFPKIDHYFPILLDALGAHGVPVQRIEPHLARAGKKDEIELTVSADFLTVAIQCEDRAALNAMRYSVTSLIDFNAREVAPDVRWSGAEVGETLPPDLRVFLVDSIEQITPKMRRIWFKGKDFARYDTLENLHSRLLFKRGRGVPDAWPQMTDAGRIRWPDGRAELDTRVYTIRMIDRELGRLAVDFFVGDHDGPATHWARNAAVGDGVGFIGPAAHGLATANFYVFAGDETGVPGVLRCLEALDRDARGVALLEVDGPQEVQPVDAPAGIEVRWLYRNGAEPGTTDLLETAFGQINWPEDVTDAAFWGGMERQAFVKIWRGVKDLGLLREKINAFAHWRRGMNEPEIAAAGSKSVRE